MSFVHVDMIYNGSKKPENRNDLSKKFNQAVVIVQ
jgi:hypothetical protein